ncbi:uncharacterized protein LOC117112861 [Anneissia japonica]|uniref:uncharacterized protein LOC117112861 n=1 Tax=Anneissia japonica TaxID=1529436 RepID=UPI001425960C|nr:uncharacterized protein LOC117112861 [Anneissia japonica]
MLPKYRYSRRPCKRLKIHFLGELLPRCYNSVCYIFVVILLKWVGLAHSVDYGLQVSPDSINLAEEDTLYLKCSCTVSNQNNYLLAWNFEDISAVERGDIPREWLVFGGYQSGEYFLRIPYINVNNAGTYECTLLDDAQNVIDSASVLVSVIPIVASDFPTCLLSRTGTLSVDMELDVVCVFKQVSLAGEQVELKRKTATGLETLAVSSPTYTSSEFTINIKTRLFLEREHHKAEFICLASEGNLEHLTSCSFQPLKVTFRPDIVLEPIFVRVPQDSTEPLRFTCTVLDAYPVEVKITWFLGDDMIGSSSDRVTQRKNSNFSYELIIYRTISTDNGANVFCEIENEIGLSVATGKIKFAVEEEITSVESLTSVWYLIIIIGCVTLGCIFLFIMCNLYFKMQREKSGQYADRSTPSRQQISTVDRPYSQRNSTVTSRSNGSSYITRAIRSELRETPSSIPKHRWSSESVHPLTDSGHSTLMQSPENLPNTSTISRSRSATPRSSTSQQSHGSRHVSRKPKQMDVLRQHKRHNYKNNPAENAGTRALSPNQRQHHKRGKRGEPTTNRPTNKNISESEQQKLYKKKKTRRERDRIRNKTTREAVTASTLYADLDFSSQSTNTGLHAPPNRTGTGERERTGHRSIPRETVSETSANALPTPRSSSSTIVYAEINPCSPRNEEPLIRNDNEPHGIDHVVEIDEN